MTVTISDPPVAAKPPVPSILYCPTCGLQHVDQLEPETQIDWSARPHKTHLCVKDRGGCGSLWTPAEYATVGVERLEEITCYFCLAPYFTVPGKLPPGWEPVRDRLQIRTFGAACDGCLASHEANSHT